MSEHDVVCGQNYTTYNNYRQEQYRLPFIFGKTFFYEPSDDAWRNTTWCKATIENMFVFHGGVIYFMVLL